jgi:hypothetical protein
LSLIPTHVEKRIPEKDRDRSGVDEFTSVSFLSRWGYKIPEGCGRCSRLWMFLWLRLPSPLGQRRWQGCFTRGTRRQLRPSDLSRFISGWEEEVLRASASHVLSALLAGAVKKGTLTPKSCLSGGNCPPMTEPTADTTTFQAEVLAERGGNTGGQDFFFFFFWW